MTRDMWSSEILRLAGWTLLNLCWQGAVLGLVALAAIKARRVASPSARYGMALAAFLVLLVVPIGTAARLTLQAEGGTRVDAEPRADAPPLASVVRAGSLALANRNDASAQASEIHKESLWSIERQRWIATMPRILPAVVRLWCAGLLIFGIRLLLDIRSVSQLRQGSECMPADEIQAAVRRIGAEIGISRSVSVIISPRAQGPVVVGVLSPIVLLPLRLANGLTSVQLDLLLARRCAIGRACVLAPRGIPPHTSTTSIQIPIDIGSR